MPEKPWYAHYEADYLLKTKWFHCAAQHGIYRAIVAELNLNGPMIDDDDELRAIAKATPEEWAAYWPKIRERFLFINDDGLLDQSRAKDERKRGGVINKNLSEAGKKGAEARWKKGKKPKPEPQELEDVKAAARAWNAICDGRKFKPIMNLTRQRAVKIAQRLKEDGGLEAWNKALRILTENPFFQGESESGWIADVDFLCTKSKFVKVIEGGYDGFKNPKKGRSAPAPTETERRQDIVDGLRAAGLAPRRVAPDGDHGTGD